MENILIDGHYTGKINCIPFTPPEFISEITKNELQIIFNDFNQKIFHAKSNDEKIEMIATYIQRIVQLHPFDDGNIRTCYILLNKLLYDHGLPLTILLNPNRFDCLSIAQLVALIKNGQAIWDKFLNNDGKKINLTTNEYIKIIKSFSVESEELTDIPDNIINEFVAMLINAHMKTEKVQSRFSSQFDAMKFFPPKSAAEKLNESVADIQDSKHHKEFVDAINKGQYTQALRKACAYNLLNVVENLLEGELIATQHINDPSTNGNTALDWLINNGKNSAEKDKMIALLEAKGGARKDNQINLKKQ